MLLLTSTSDKLQVVTSASVTVDVHASFVDLNGSTVTPGRTNTAISTTTTTDVVGAPGSGTTRNVKTLSVRNKHASSDVTVTIVHTDGTTAVELEKRTLGPGQTLQYVEGFGFVANASNGGSLARPWHGVVAGACGYGDPDELMVHCQRAGNVAATPTNITTSIARCTAFRLPADMVVDRIRAFGLGVTTDVYRVALYRYSDLARLTSELAFTTAVDTWISIGSNLNVSLTKDTLYFIACAVNATGTTPGVLCKGGTVAATTGRVNTGPNSLPGSMALSGGYFSGFDFQFSVTSGALPDPAATPAAQGAWTGGAPAFWLDSADS
jgi:hypothetical protein